VPDICRENLDFKNIVGMRFHASEDLTESKLELVLERFYKGDPIQQSEQQEDETEEADVLSISVPRSMFTDDKPENLQKLIEGKLNFLNTHS